MGVVVVHPHGIFNRKEDTAMSDPREKSRYWAFIYYEDSPIKNPKEKLIELGARALISPWHDKDINEDTGELKKKHKHIIVIWEGPATEKQAKKISDQFNSPRPIPQINLKGAVLYLTHTNNPEKAQYKQTDIELVGYDTLQEVIDLTASAERSLISSIMEEVKKQNFTEYWDLVNYYGKQGLIYEFDYLVNHTMLWTKLLDSRRNKQLQTFNKYQKYEQEKDNKKQKYLLLKR
jgi:hypothetical protein